ncbi:unnamed protein product [Cuscuta campestris]|nr:hypothetical protein DM860_013305 [Cuscuta australis]VFQ99171.1 unnamed protein product [Cuscuta campestris]
MGSWTAKQNKKFEEALAIYDRETRDRWEQIARFVGGKSVEEVKRHYEVLEKDVMAIENGRVAMPKYKTTPESCTTKHHK